MSPVLDVRTAVFVIDFTRGISLVFQNPLPGRKIIWVGVRLQKGIMLRTGGVADNSQFF